MVPPTPANKSLLPRAVPCTESVVKQLAIVFCNETIIDTTGELKSMLSDEGQDIVFPCGSNSSIQHELLTDSKFRTHPTGHK
jgi:hypothetical protein